MRINVVFSLKWKKEVKRRAFGTYLEVYN